MSDTLTTLYSGVEKLVLGFDVGTTSSAVSICHLSPGLHPSVRTVSYWPASPTESKLPSLVYFDTTGRPVAFGAACLTPEMKARARAESLHLAEWFKLHLHPESMEFETTATLVSALGGLNLDSNNKGSASRSIIPAFDVPSLPANVSIGVIYSSFLGYLFAETKSWFLANTEGGVGIWSKLVGSAELVMATPDGWDDTLQAVLKKAFVDAGILRSVTDDRLEFLRESEASVHFALKSVDVKAWLKPGEDFTVADLGGSTVDVCMYHCDSISPTLQLREVKTSDSVQAGGVFVDRAARTLVEAKLAGSKLAGADTIESIISIFEEKTKRRFTGSGEASIIKFGTSQETDRHIGVNMGRLTLSSDELETTFKFCTNEILASIKQQLRMGERKSSHLIVTGGFGESPYLKGRLRSFFDPFGVSVFTGDEPSKKAVAEGCVLWHLSQMVVARAVRSTFGDNVAIRYSPRNPEHLGRHSFAWPDGVSRVAGAWSTIVPKGTIMRSEEPLEGSFSRQLCDTATLSKFVEEVYIYEGDDKAPRWCTLKSGALLPNFSVRAKVVANLSPLRSILKPIKYGTVSMPASPDDLVSGNCYWRINFNVCLFVAQTSLKAKITWTENGILREGPATIVIVEPADRAGGPQDRRRLPADIVARP